MMLFGRLQSLSLKKNIHLSGNNNSEQFEIIHIRFLHHKLLQQRQNERVCPLQTNKQTMSEWILSEVLAAAAGQEGRDAPAEQVTVMLSDSDEFQRREKEAPVGKGWIESFFELSEPHAEQLRPPEPLGSRGKRKIKIIAIGDGASGKTCYYTKLLSGNFPGVYLPTVIDMLATNVRCYARAADTFAARGCAHGVCWFASLFVVPALAAHCQNMYCWNICTCNTIGNVFVLTLTSHWVPSLSLSFQPKSLKQTFVDGSCTSVECWDTAGAEDYDRLRPVTTPPIRFVFRELEDTDGVPHHGIHGTPSVSSRVGSKLGTSAMECMLICAHSDDSS